jgi:hypothetical protein
MQINSVGIDLGKTTFHLVALGEAGKVLGGRHKREQPNILFGERRRNIPLEPHHLRQTGPETGDRYRGSDRGPRRPGGQDIRRELVPEPGGQRRDTP